jgi:hypothetical protein
LKGEVDYIQRRVLMMLRRVFEGGGVEGVIVGMEEGEEEAAGGGGVGGIGGVGGGEVGGLWGEEGGAGGVCGRPMWPGFGCSLDIAFDEGTEGKGGAEEADEAEEANGAVEGHATYRRGRMNNVSSS